MRSLRFIDRQAGYSLSAISLLVALVAPGLVPAFASADGVTTRSIALSSSSADASDVTYEVKFTATKAASAFLLDFCNDSPIVGEACTAPDGFNATGVGTTGSDTVTKVSNSLIKVVLGTPLTAGADADVVLTGLHNPTNATDGSAGNNFYARIVTYSSSTGDIDDYTSTVPGTYQDEGGVAMAITSDIAVTGKVLENLVFCVSSTEITGTCADSDLHTPSVSLGTDGVLGTTVTAGNPIYTDISTNAASGAVVNLKSDADGCGGLRRAGALDKCDIGPSSTNVADNSATFGVKLSALTVAGGTGLVEAANYKNNVSPSNFYDATNYKIHFNNTTDGVTSTYGDPILDTNGGPVNNGKLDLTFAASTNDATPAGRYSANLSLIATGKF